MKYQWNLLAVKFDGITSGFQWHTRVRSVVKFGGITTGKTLYFSGKTVVMVFSVLFSGFLGNTSGLLIGGKIW